MQADVVVEYTLQEAEDVLNKSLKVANKYLEEAVSGSGADEVTATWF